ncbi:MAG: fumarate hydrolyase [Candidatus Diapherotrites archaeon CG08_land_8_20_14_0_20_34_12]|nr:MAG: fumarate hydrolyase [Candidatus Diapherotrites archaeon CG08_land_8_20_14_0_20_34_12]
MIKLELPISNKDLLSLRVGNYVEVSGIIFTLRDKASRWLLEEKIPEKIKQELKNPTIYHCGPIIKKTKDAYKVISAGPTTSERMLPYLSGLNKRFGISLIIGKGGFRNTDIFKKNKMVYLHTLSGCGALLAQKIVKVHYVFKLQEFGMPEAIWKIEVKALPAIVTIDADGNNLHDSIYKQSEKLLKNRK